MPIEKDKKQLLARNSLYGLFSWLLPLVPSLFVTPIVVKYIGVANYGLYLAILGLTSYFFTLGVGKIATKYVAQFGAANDQKLANGYFTATVVVALLPTLVCLVGVLVTSSWVIRDVLHIDPAFVETAERGLWLAAVMILASGTGQVWLGALQGLHRFRTYFWLSNITSVSLSAGILLIAVLGGGVLAILGWTTVMATITLLMAVITVRGASPALQLSSVPTSAWGDVWSYAGSIFGYQLFGLILLLVERGLIIRNFGLEALSFYLVPMNLALLVPAVVSNSMLALFPVLNENLHDRATIVKLYERASKVMLMIALFSMVTAAASGASFLRLWLGDAFAERSSSLLLIHTVAFSISAVLMINWHIAETFGVAPVTAAANAAVTVLSLPLIVILSGPLQLQGVAIGRLIGLIPLFVLLLYLERRFMGGGSFKRWVPFIAIMLVPATASYLIQVAAGTLLSANWIGFCLTLALGSGVFLAVSIILRQIDVVDMTSLFVSFRRKQPDA